MIDREEIDARKAAFPERFVDGPGEFRVLRDNNGKWTDAGMKLDPEWRRAVEQPREYSDAPVKRDVSPIPRVNAKPMPGKAKPIGRPTGSVVFAPHLTAARIMDLIKAGTTLRAAAKDAGVHQSLLTLRLKNAPQAIREEFAAMHRCECGRTKHPHVTRCKRCKAAQCLPDTPRAGEGSGWRRRKDITVAAIQERLDRGMTQLAISVEFGCAYSVVNRRLAAAKRAVKLGTVETKNDKGGRL